MPSRKGRAKLIARWAEYTSHLLRARVLPTLAYAKAIAERDALLSEQRSQVLVMVKTLEGIADLFRGPIRFRIIPQLELATQRFACTLINLSAWDGDDAALKFWAQELLRDEKAWPNLGEVATIPLLEGKANWTEAGKPVSYLATAARRHKSKADRKYRPRADEVPLDQVGEIAAGSSLTHDPLGDAIAAVLAHIRDREELVSGELHLRGNTDKEIGRTLGWRAKRLNRVAVRFRRHLKVAARTSDLQTLRQILSGWRANASRTIAHRTFRDDQEGRLYDYFEHRDDWQNPPET